MKKEGEFAIFAKTFVYLFCSICCRQENVSLQAKLGVLERQCRDLLVYQGSTVSGAAVALSALISRLGGLVEELVTSYNISDEELDVSNVISYFIKKK